MTNKKLKSIKPEDYRRSFTKALCGDCKYADVPRNRKPCCSCSWLERECYFEEAEDEMDLEKRGEKYLRSHYKDG